MSRSSFSAPKPCHESRESSGRFDRRWQFRLVFFDCSLSPQRCTSRRGRRARSTKHSCPRWSRKSFALKAHLCSDSSSPATWRAAPSALRSAPGCHPWRRSGSGWWHFWPGWPESSRPSSPALSPSSSSRPSSPELARGVAISAAKRALLAGATISERAPILSVIYLVSYTATVLPSLLAGQLSNVFTLPQIAVG